MCRTLIHVLFTLWASIIAPVIMWLYTMSSSTVTVQLQSHHLFLKILISRYYVDTVFELYNVISVDYVTMTTPTLPQLCRNVRATKQGVA